jgi:hypothetical protein
MESLPLKEVFKSVMGRRICQSSRAVSECLRGLQRQGKIRTLNQGIAIELLEDIKVEYVQSSLVRGKL